MRARISLPSGLVFLSILTFGCVDQRPQTSPAQAPSPQSATPARSNAHPAEAPVAQAPEAPAEPDEATLLAKKTSEYAQNVTPLLNQGSAPTSRPSIVQWSESPRHRDHSDDSPRAERTPLANRPASLAAEHIREDNSLPMILPESADQIPQATRNDGSPVAVSTDAYELSLRKLVSDYPRDLGNQLDYQLLRFVRDEPTPELSNVSQLSDEDRDILLALMDGLNNFRAAARSDGNLMLNRKIEPLLEMADRLRSEAQLAIPTIAFCTHVSGYGVYVPMASSRFPAGRNSDLIVYCEAANFTSVQGSDRIWRTRFKQDMVLYTDTGLAVWPEKPNTTAYVDESRNRRHDFFIPRRVRLPSSLAAGKYVLKITLTDEESNRIVEAGTPLEIVAAAPSSDAATPAADHTELPLPSLSP